jgi:DNA-binding Lrp family transcriptional regulator
LGDREQFSFLKFPRALIDSSLFSGLSVDAKLLFAMILDRTGLSEINADRFTDSYGNIFVVYTINEICEKLGCARAKAVRLLKELQNSGLIEKYRDGCGKPSKIIIAPSALSMLKIEPDKYQNQTSGSVKTELREVSESNSIYNKENNNNIIYINPSISYDELIESIEEQIEYDCINGDAEMVREIILIMADVMSGTTPTVRIGGSDFPREIVISRFKKLSSEHIEYVIGCIESSTTKIKNIKSYLISALYNAPSTMASSVSAEFAFYNNN